LEVESHEEIVAGTTVCMLAIQLNRQVTNCGSYKYSVARFTQIECITARA